MKIGLYGGSFDPIHNGHVSMIRGALDSGVVDIVIVIPSARNPFKPGRALTCAPYRYYMVKDVIEDLFDDDVFLSDIEFKIEGISYTDTVVDRISDPAYISAFLEEQGISSKKANASHKFCWIAGSDCLESLATWHNAASLVSKISFLVAFRPGDDCDIPKVAKETSDALGIPVDITTFDIDGVEIASSDIRRTGNFDGIPKAARSFIDEHDLYEACKILEDCSDDACKRFTDAAIWMYGYLRKKRLLHTLNTGLLSAYLAKCHGADIDKALIAGAVHDCAKELPIEDQERMSYARCGDLFVDEKLLHSPAGAVFYSESFGEDDPEILDAITYHTTGRGDATLLDEIVFLADKIEPSRTYTDLSVMRKIAPTDLDGAARLCLESVVDKFKRKKRPVHPLTEGFMKYLGMQ
ncbi:MAG: bis(5'-nucleosyl)-tetraphosphatase (symmetrical) YqeK [Clostridiales bacterium]|nr:bis(5'-nucleosyl)-tetraphosphatase (symmetrical) YqeK [Clostridiales bacterium]